ncbi:hypothetical protein [Nocardioides limicola]|uniref:hypothetical protein n=1 Tax=Nocardioides limicola TaxID=2803368 RepID=UPI00193B5DA1|nr:hypothetical protein [Nocardioides sp. DJM-14]
MTRARADLEEALAASWVSRTFEVVRRSPVPDPFVTYTAHKQGAISPVSGYGSYMVPYRWDGHDGLPNLTPWEHCRFFQHFTSGGAPLAYRSVTCQCNFGEVLTKAEELARLTSHELTRTLPVYPEESVSRLDSVIESYARLAATLGASVGESSGDSLISIEFAEIGQLTDRWVNGDSVAGAAFKNNFLIPARLNHIHLRNIAIHLHYLAVAKRVQVISSRLNVLSILHAAITAAGETSQATAMVEDMDLRKLIGLAANAMSSPPTEVMSLISTTLGLVESGETLKQSTTQILTYDVPEHDPNQIAHALATDLSAAGAHADDAEQGIAARMAQVIELVESLSASDLTVPHMGARQ